MILTLIVLIVLINFYVKKDVILATLIGLILLNVFLLTTYDTGLIKIVNLYNFKIFINIMLYFGIFYVFRNINALTSFTNSKKEIQSIFDYILKDKKLKIFTLLMLGAFFSLVPTVGIIYMIFAAVFLRISKINMVLIPFFSIGIFIIFNFLTQLDAFVGDTAIGINFLVILFIGFIVFILIEKLRKLEKVRIREIIVDIIFSILMLIVNIYIYMILAILYSVYASCILSLILTFIISVFFLNKYAVFINKDHKEELEEKKISYLSKLKLPYMTLFLLIFIEVIGYVLLIFNFYIGSIFIIALNGIIYYKFRNYIKYKIEKKNIKMIILAIAVFLTFIVLNNILKIQSTSLENIINNKVIYLEGPLTLLINSLALVLTVKIDFLASLQDKINITSIVNLRLLVLLQIQSFFSFLMMCMVQYVFELKKQELVSIVTILLISSVLLQLIIYIY